MYDYSIEYAHIYTNAEIGEEHELSLEILGHLRDKLSKEEKSSSLVIMVDDYSFPDPSFDYEAFSKWLSEKGFKPDLMIRESQLIPLCDEVVDSITDENLKDELTRYVKSKKYPCSLFIAAWYLLRLGRLSSALFPEHLVAEQIHNILPESFKPYEDKGLEIIAKSNYSGDEKKIEYSFIKGRGLA